MKWSTNGGKVTTYPVREVGIRELPFLTLGNKLEEHGYYM